VTSQTRILVVDDDARLAASLRHALAYEGHAVEVAANRPAALVAARDRPPDLVVLDGMRGVEARVPRSGGHATVRLDEATSVRIEPSFAICSGRCEGSSGMPASLVHFVCWVKHPDLHVRGRPVLVDQLQIHDKKWAYCAGGGKSDHLWEAIDPLSLVDVQLHDRWRREREQSERDSPTDRSG
jgi:hypothetical protein